MSRTTLRATALPGLVALLVSLLSSLVVAAPAHAADAYRFWGYYQLGGQTWAFATKGPDQTVPKDGSVEGYRYALGDMSTPRLPRAVVTFDKACASTPAEAGKKRVGVVVDFGRPADARDASTQAPQPYAACAVVPTTATGAQVLAAVATVRAEKSMVCGIDGYPATGCSDTVKSVPADAKAADQPVEIAARGASSSASQSGSGAAQPSSSAAAQQSSGSSTGFVVGIVAVLALLAAALWALARRRRTDVR